MNNYSDCEVARAVLAQSIFINNVGTLGPTLSSVQNPTMKATKMQVVGNFLELRVEDKFRKTVVELVPMSAVLQITPILK